MTRLEEQFKNELMGSHSTAKSKAVAKQVNSKKDVQAILNLIDPKYDYPTPEAACWCLRNATSHIPELHTFIATEIVKPLELFDRDSLIKNILGTLKVIELPKDSYGLISNYCLNFLTQPTRSKAVLYYSLELMTIICKEVPELKRELFMIVDDFIPLASDAFNRKYVKVRNELK